MRILQLTKYYPPHMGGMEGHVKSLSEKLSEDNEVIVVTANPEKQNQVTVFRHTPWFTKFNAPLIPGTIIDLLREDYDILHFHHPDPFTSLFAYTASVLRRKPLVVTYHADIVGKPGTRIYNIFLNQLLKHAKRIIATTPTYIQKSKTLQKHEHKTTTIPNSTNTKKFTPRNTDFKQKHNIEGDMILFLGRLVPYKGVDILIEAFEMMEQHTTKPRTLVIAGKGQQLEELKEKAKHNKDIIFVDPDEEGVLNLYRACDLFVLPSVTDQEAFGIVLLEAMSCGKPVLGTNVGGVPYLVGEDNTVEPNNPLLLAAKMVIVLADREKMKQTGKANRKRAVEEFDTDVTTKKMRLLYRTILDDVGWSKK